MSKTEEKLSKLQTKIANETLKVVALKAEEKKLKELVKAEKKVKK